MSNADVDLTKIERKHESLMPDHSELTTDLASRAFEMIGCSEFSVSASLSVDDSESLRNYGTFESILLMAYKMGLADGMAKAGGAV